VALVPGAAEGTVVPLVAAFLPHRGRRHRHFSQDAATLLKLLVLERTIELVTPAGPKAASERRSTD